MSGQSSASTSQELLSLEACADTSEPRSPPCSEQRENSAPRPGNATPSRSLPARQTRHGTY